MTSTQLFEVKYALSVLIYVQLKQKYGNFCPILVGIRRKLGFRESGQVCGKIELVGGFCDPYIIPLDRMTSLVSAKEIPDVQSPDIFTYLKGHVGFGLRFIGRFWAMTSV